MTRTLAVIDRELAQVLWAYLEYWQTCPIEPRDRQVCFSWMLPIYQRRFGGRFHQSALARLVQLGILTEGDRSRGGGRRYYGLVSVEVASGLVRATVG